MVIQMEWVDRQIDRQKGRERKRWTDIYRIFLYEYADGWTGGWRVDGHTEGRMDVRINE